MSECDRLENEYQEALARLAVANRLTLEEMETAMDEWLERAENGDTGGK